MNEQRIVQAGDTVSIGVCGKRPFGNSYYYDDIADILGWQKPNEELSDKQTERADQLLYELPFMLNNILEEKLKEIK